MKKILILEDDAIMSSFLETLLKLEGYEVVKLSTNQALLPMIQQLQADLLVIDIYLGNGYNGIELVKQLRALKNFNQPKVLLSSGEDQSHASSLAGANEFLLKPYMPAELIEKINSLLI